MEKIIYFFQHIHSTQRMLMLVGGLVFFWMLESIIPLFRMHYRKGRHALLNIFFTITTIVVNFIFGFSVVEASDFAQRHNAGILHLFPMPMWLFILVGLLFLDLISSWLIHWIQHQIKWMWKFHLIHHTDTYVDTTTANRHHPVESLFRAAFTFLAVLVTGAPLWLVFLYQFLSVLFSQFNHANISLPLWLDDLLSWFIVSPNMHKAHHHYRQPLTDSNYGNIFSVWDRLFGTYRHVKDMSALQYGIDTYPEEKENSAVGKLLKIPFEAYRAPKGSKFSEHGLRE